MPNILIATRYGGIADHEAVCVVRSTVNSLVSNPNNTVFADTSAQAQFPELKVWDVHQPVEFVIVFGGDGTMVNTATRFTTNRWTERPVKIIGVNAGNLGFITDLALKSAQADLAAVLDGNFTLEPRSLLEVSVGGLALNDVVLRGTTGQVLGFKVTVDDTFAYHCRADGLILSTPTGSTAYSSSAGGAIIFPTADVIEMIPVAPQTLTHRPLILPGTSAITVELTKGVASLYCDGVSREDNIEPGMSITIKRSDLQVTFCHPTGGRYNFFATLREKLFWHVEPGTKF